MIVHLQRIPAAVNLTRMMQEDEQRTISLRKLIFDVDGSTGHIRQLVTRGLLCQSAACGRFFTMRPSPIQTNVSRHGYPITSRSHLPWALIFDSHL